MVPTGPVARGITTRRYRARRGDGRALTRPGEISDCFQELLPVSQAPPVTQDHEAVWAAQVARLRLLRILLLFTLLLLGIYAVGVPMKRMSVAIPGPIAEAPRTDTAKETPPRETPARDAPPRETPPRETPPGETPPPVAAVSPPVAPIDAGRPGEVASRGQTDAVLAAPGISKVLLAPALTWLDRLAESARETVVDVHERQVRLAERLERRAAALATVQQPTPPSALSGSGARGDRTGALPSDEGPQLADPAAATDGSTVAGTGANPAPGSARPSADGSDAVEGAPTATVVDGSTAGTPAVDATAAGTPAADTPVVEAPAAGTPAVEAPLVLNPAADAPDPTLPGSVSAGPADFTPPPPPPPDVFAPPRPRLVLFNPGDNGGVVRYLFNGKVHALEPGQRQEVADEGPHIVHFHRGDTFGNARYRLKDGTYAFRVTPGGWDLHRLSDARAR